MRPAAAYEKRAIFEVVVVVVGVIYYTTERGKLMTRAGGGIELLSTRTKGAGQGMKATEGPSGRTGRLGAGRETQSSSVSQLTSAQPSTIQRDGHNLDESAIRTRLYLVGEKQGLFTQEKKISYQVAS